ncbi:hypothetical protein SDC9_188980 [bioreactor metagenome]|uniref:Uncharacterized protein n=1 Tax=bioreactor metagenome TaxID=1076179 RepID=A0A645HZ53_9ZZZZ
MKADGLLHLKGDSEDRIKRCHRLLEDHSDLPPAQGTHPIRSQAQQLDLAVFPVKARGASADFQRVGQQLHQGICRNAFAAAAFPHNTKTLLLTYIQIDLVHQLNDIFSSRGTNLQAADFQQVFHLFASYSFSLGSSTSRSASPSTLNDRIVRMMNSAGNMTSHGAISMYLRASESMEPQDGLGG